MEIKLINCFSCVIPTINFQRLKILLVSLLFFIVKYIFLETVCKIIDGKIYLLTYLAAMEAPQWRAENPFEHLRWSFFEKLINGFFISAKRLHRRCLTGF